MPIALAGCGFMGAMHAQIYAQLPQTRLVAVADRRVDAARSKLGRLGFPVPVYESLGELLKHHPEIAVVDICTPADAHEADAALALAGGKHVFCEKPLAPTIAAADRMVAQAAAAVGFFQVGHCIRFWPEYQALREFVRAGRGGRLLSLSLQRQAGRPGYSDGDWLNQPARSGGAALDLHIHDTDFVMALLGAPAAVTSRATFDYSGPAHIFTLYDYPGVAVSAEGGWNYPEKWGFRMAFQALFEEACVDFDSGRSPTLTVTAAGREAEPLPFDVPASGRSAGGEGNIASLGGYFNELKYFVDRIVSGQAPAQATVADARNSLAVVLAEIESARANRSVPIALRGVA
ncbi:MAG TPA: Gfo/Idh/MocA family oxidoreductase [Opitutaceae bacterium]|jgi:predicted dehydrogenase|nr:Gfo/Idh/MocA family oxidoreductase [Opitutaceae bacterium]